jgi:predicted ATPase
MKLISRMTVNYFRSFHTETIHDLSDLNIFAGANDAGKSNVLRALHLFFNGSVGFREQLFFAEDFNVRRLTAIRKSIKMKQFISVRLSFERPPYRYPVLPERFEVERTWFRDAPTYTQKDDLERRFRAGECHSKDLGRVRASLNRLLGAVALEYVPAVKDASVLEHYLVKLHDLLLNPAPAANRAIQEAKDRFNEVLSERTKGLSEGFLEATSLKNRLRLPEDMGRVLRSLEVETTIADNPVSLDRHGDGVKLRFLPVLLHNLLREGGRRLHVWAFEEPENSTELARVQKLAEDFADVYAKDAQVFLTTHSFLLTSLDRPNCSIYRVRLDDCESRVSKIPPTNVARPTDAGAEILGELGILAANQPLYEAYERVEKEQRELNAIVRDLQQTLTNMQKPLVVVEGKWDRQILEVAWARFYPSRALPIAIQPSEQATCAMSGSACEVRRVAEAAGLAVRSGAKVVCLFDHDQAGEREYGLLSSPNWQVLADCKRRPQAPVFACLLPIPEDRQDCARKWHNLCLEFYSDRNELEQAFSLTKRRITSKDQFGNEVGAGECEEFEAMLLSDHKQQFAQVVVPSLPASSFHRFKGLFELLGRLLELDAA